MMAVLTLWVPAKQFASNLNIPNNPEVPKNFEATSHIMHAATFNEWDNIEKNLNSLKHLSFLVNQVFGNCVTLFLVESLLGYGVCLDDLILQQNDPEWRTLIAGVIYFAHCHCVVIFAADIPYQAS